MYRFLRLIAVALVIVFAISSTSSAITRVARKLNMMDIYAGGSIPWGTYNGTPGDKFILEGQRYEFDGDQVYDNGFFIGFDYGQLFSEHFLFTVGFCYTHQPLKDTIQNDEVAFFYTEGAPTLHLYDLNVNLNYLFANLYDFPVSPYVGVGIQPGIASTSLEGYYSRNELTFGMSVNFGAEFKIFTAPSGRSFVTLASDNSWNFVGSNDRPKFFNIGGAIRYYFRP